MKILLIGYDENNYERELYMATENQVHSHDTRIKPVYKGYEIDLNKFPELRRFELRVLDNNGIHIP